MAEKTEKQSERHPAEMTTAEAIAQLAASLKPQGPLEQAGLTPQAIDQLTKPPTPKKYRMIPCKSEETGATFTAHVVESKKYPNGRIVSLHDYTHPEGMFTYARDGGRVPDNFPILKDANGGALGEGVKLEKHQLSVMYLQWRWTEFWQRDLSRFVGKEISAHHCVDAAGMKTPWLEGAVRPLVTEDS